MPRDLYLLEYATDKDGLHMENIATQLKKGMAWEVSLPVMTKKKEHTVYERSMNFNHNNEEEYPTLTLQQNTDLREDLSDLPSDNRNRALRQEYPILADESNIIIICKELPLNKAMEEQISTAEKKRLPVNKNKKQITSNYEFRKPRTRSRTTHTGNSNWLFQLLCHHLTGYLWCLSLG